MALDTKAFNTAFRRFLLSSILIALSGCLGNIVDSVIVGHLSRIGYVRTSSCTRAHMRIYAFDSDHYKRTTPVSTRELQVRNRFRAVAAAVKERAEDLSKVTQDQAAFLAQKDLANGKKTMRAYLWYVCGQEYDQNNG